MSDRSACWRSHTFSDGTSSITLTQPLDAPTAERLGNRLHELALRGCERLIVEVSPVAAAGVEAPRLLATALETDVSDCQLVVVVPRSSSLDELLPPKVAVAWSLSDARMLLAIHPTRRAARKRPGPGSVLSPEDRHVLAVRQVMRWAAQTARTGDHRHA